MPHRTAWTAKEDKLLGTAPDSEIAKQLNRAPHSVARRRRALKVLAFRQPTRFWYSRWRTPVIAMYLQCSDAEVARITGRSLKDVQAKRQALQ